VELFPPPPKPPGCDFKQWIDDEMTPKDATRAAYLKNIDGPGDIAASSSK